MEATVVGHMHGHPQTHRGQLVMENLSGNMGVRTSSWEIILSVLVKLHAYLMHCFEQLLYEIY